MKWNVTISFQVDEDDYDAVKGLQGVAKLVDAMLEGEANLPRRYGHAETITITPAEGPR